MAVGVGATGGHFSPKLCLINPYQNHKPQTAINSPTLVPPPHLPFALQAQCRQPEPRIWFPFQPLNSISKVTNSSALVLETGRPKLRKVKGWLRTGASGRALPVSPSLKVLFQDTNQKLLTSIIPCAHSRTRNTKSTEEPKKVSGSRSDLSPQIDEMATFLSCRAQITLD